MKITQRHVIIVAFLAVSTATAYFVGMSITGRYVVGGDYDDLAKCLTTNGAVLYGSAYCGHCKNQKDIFGDSFQYVTYVECTEQTQLCQQKGIAAVPTWEINDELHTGLKSLEELADMVGCSLG